MAESYFRAASMDYVYLIQEFHERKKFEFVETLLSFLFGWLTFYHQGHEVANDFRPFMVDLQTKIQKTRTNFNDYKDKLKTRMAEVKKQCLEEPIRNAKGCKAGYLYLLEKKAFGTTWTKYYCTYNKETKEFTMLPYNQQTSKSITHPETMVLTQCIRRMSDSIDKRFCFDIQCDTKPGVVFTFQALSEQDRTSWLDIMDGKEPTYVTPSVNKVQNAEERILDDIGIQFLKRCIEVLENRGLEEQGLYRVVGVTSKVNKLLAMGLDRRKCDKLAGLDDPQEWESKTITSALKNYLRNLPEPIMTYRYHNGFIAAAKNKDVRMRVNDIHTLVYRLPKQNMEVLKLLIKHLKNVAAKCGNNLMTTSNLGVCFGPTLLRPEEETVASITDLKFYNVVVEVLIENHDRIFNTEPEKVSADDRRDQRSPVNSSNSVPYNNIQGPMSPSELLPSTYIGPDGTELVHSNNPRNFNTNDHLNNSHYLRNQHMWKPSYTCTVKAYYEPPAPPGNTSSSLYNVHETPNNGISNNMSRNEHLIPINNHGVSNDRLHRYKHMVMSSVNSQSESSIPNLPSFSPTNLRSYSRLGPNSSSSSNESISSTSKEGNTSYTAVHKKGTTYNAYPKSSRSPGNVTSAKDPNSSNSSGKPNFLTRVR
ncbi:hypothetical protein HHI36_010159 [Cryptolaemus montrouzieri]|uniref:Rho GTPase-activating protein 26 n=1 Tax=Cryptolaemus montrouzieri TaxID=559131 RepID=A0ABD2MHU9_9CUCU